VVKINLVVLLVCVVFFAGCAGGAEPLEEGAVSGGEDVAAGGEDVVSGGEDVVTGSDDDVWDVLESVEELNGEWEGLSVLSAPSDRSKGLPKTVFNVNLSLSCADLYVVRRIKIFFAGFLADMLAAHPDSDLTVDDLWESYFENNYAGYDLIREEYALVIEYSEPAADIINGKIGETGETSRLYINQDGTRLREFLRGGLLGALLEPFGVSGDVEFVLDRL
jgi:hypothetical protein